MAMYRNKPVTRKDLANRLGIPLDSIEQVDSKQLFIIYGHMADYLVSYYTIVGFRPSGNKVWKITTMKYSPTTSKQLNQFAYGRQVDWVEGELIPDRVE